MRPSSSPPHTATTINPSSIVPPPPPSSTADRRRQRGGSCFVRGSKGDTIRRRSRWMPLVGAAATAAIASGAVGAAAAAGGVTAFAPGTATTAAIRGIRRAAAAETSSSRAPISRVVSGSSHRSVLNRRTELSRHRPLHQLNSLDSRLQSVSCSFAARTTQVSSIGGQSSSSTVWAAGRSPRLEVDLLCVTTGIADSCGEESGGTEATMTSSPTMDLAATVDTSAPSDTTKHADDGSNRTGARRVPSTPESISACATRLRRGELVAFPTETVYGLGCDALSHSAALKIFAAKERPHTDPLISHVASADDAFALWSVGDDGEDGATAVRALRALTDRFWPGPLTLVFDASPDVPPIVTANTGRAAVRCPAHPLARALIAEAGTPIAAPSANKFGHVSPTRADHVVDDLGDEDVWVIDPDMDAAAAVVNGDGGGSAAEGESPRSGGEATPPCCRVGVESTVALVDQAARTVSVLRHGAVSPGDIRDCLAGAGVVGYRVVDVKGRQAEESASGVSPSSNDDHSPREGGEGDVVGTNVAADAAAMASTAVVVGDVSPGQTVRHYSPHVPSLLVSSDRCRNGEADVNSSLRPGEAEALRGAVVIDFGGRLSFVRDRCLAYRDLSPGGCSGEAASAVFECLRWAERVEGARRVYFPEIVPSSPSPSSSRGRGEGEEGEEEDALTLALRDRLTRAASAVVTDEFR